MQPEDVSFHSHGVRCAAWRYTGEGDEFASEHGRPCVVMAHGFGATRDSGLGAYAERFASEGLDVVLFDYRSLGDSEGEPRQNVDWRHQREDYEAAIAFARGLDGVDPEGIVLWGTSYSGGHVVAVAAGDPQIAAVISHTGAVDAPAALMLLSKQQSPAEGFRTTWIAIRDFLRGLREAEPIRVPIVGEPGSLAAMATPDALPGMRSIAGPTWRNEVCAREGLRMLGNRALKAADGVRCPILFQIAEHDDVVPNKSIEKAAWRAKGRAEVRRYPYGHFDIYLGEARERVLADQVHFLRRHLVAERTPAAVAA